jgi:hypothetical protein
MCRAREAVIHGAMGSGGVRHTLRGEDCGSKSHEAAVLVIKPMAVGLDAAAHVRA